MRPLAAIVAALLFTLPVRAGIYNPAEPFIFEIGADGFAKPVQFSGGFDLLLAKVRQCAILPQNPGDPDNYERAQAIKRVKEREAKGVATLPAEEVAGLTADLIRLNRNEEALNILQPLARDRVRGGFLAYAHLARAHAARGEWREAFEQEQMAVRYSDFPTSFGKLTKPQLAWLKRVERDYYLPFLSHRAEEGRRPRGDLREDVDVLFPTAPPPRLPPDPVKFVGEDGSYVAGTIAAAERKKLPPDALAIVQQLVLWHPQDARLYWLLGELYNADGDVPVASRILDDCSFTMGYSNPNVIDHRRVLKSAADEMAAAQKVQADRLAAEQAAEKERQVQAERDYWKRFWWIVACGVAFGVLLIYYQLRELTRRIRRRR